MTAPGEEAEGRLWKAAAAAVGTQLGEEAGANLAAAGRGRGGRWGWVGAVEGSRVRVGACLCAACSTWVALG